MSKQANYTKNLVLCALFVALITVGAYIKIPLGYMTLSSQFLFTNLAGVFLKKWWGSLSCLMYVLLGLFGVPVFVSGGGFSYVLKPTFGYLIGFIVGAFVCGLMIEKLPCKFAWILLASLVNMAIVYICGMIYYYFIVTLYIGDNITLKTFFVSCFLVTLPGDILSCAVSAILGKRLIPILSPNVKNKVKSNEASDTICNEASDTICNE
ncbi:MAG: biotin transporter BioY, partial [Clostridia bacterium]